MTLWLSTLAGIGAIIVAVLAYAEHEMGVVGVQSAKRVTAVELKNFVDGPMGHYSSMFSGVFYAGSDEACDYIAARHGRFTVGAFKLRRGEVQIRNRMSLTSNERDWLDITREFPSPAPSGDIKPDKLQDR
jgi:hypothetical protein